MNSFQRRALARFAAATIVSSAVIGIALRSPASASPDDRVQATAVAAAASTPARVDMRAQPQADFEARPRWMARLALRTGAPAAVWSARKSAARLRGFVPSIPPTDVAVHLHGRPAAGPDKTPALDIAFQGMADSPSVCPYFGGCEPPDQALAASPSWVLQGVNTSFAVYSPAGAPQTGWPKTAQAFFNVPNPGACDPLGPFMSNPRALYDPIDGRFWATALQTEGAFGLNTCAEKSTLWVAVSQTSDPRGAWWVFSFGLRGQTMNAADFPQIGLDGQAFYFSANMFDIGGGTFQYAELFAASKAKMEGGSAVLAHGLRGITFNGVLVDTLQPVMVEGASPPAPLFVASQNITEGGGNCVAGCTSVRAFAMANPLGTPTVSAAAATVLPYSLAPQADEPNCFACIDTLDTRISATPLYSGGLISFGLDTAVANGTQVVPGVLWGQLAPSFNGQLIKRVTVKQNGVLFFIGDQAASFPALMTDAAGDLVMVFDTMGANVNPGIEFAGRSVADPLGQFSAPSFLQHGRRTFDQLWGEYAAASFEGTSTNRIWLSSEYGASNGDWATAIGALHF